MIIPLPHVHLVVCVGCGCLCAVCAWSGAKLSLRQCVFLAPVPSCRLPRLPSARGRRKVQCCNSTRRTSGCEPPRVTDGPGKVISMTPWQRAVVNRPGSLTVPVSHGDGSSRRHRESGEEPPLPPLTPSGRKPCGLLAHAAMRRHLRMREFALPVSPRSRSTVRSRTALRAQHPCRGTHGRCCFLPLLVPHHAALQYCGARRPMVAHAICK
jgi:hypothetical protein